MSTGMTTRKRKQARIHWSAEEDAKLSQVVRDHRGVEDAQTLPLSSSASRKRCKVSWDKVAALAGLVRTGKQCRGRWQGHLDPTLSQAPWTEEETRRLMRLVRECRSRWAQISTMMPGRSAQDIKNRVAYVRRRKSPLVSESPEISALPCASISTSTSSSADITNHGYQDRVQTLISALSAVISDVPLSSQHPIEAKDCNRGMDSDPPMRAITTSDASSCIKRDPDVDARADLFVKRERDAYADTNTNPLVKVDADADGYADVCLSWSLGFDTITNASLGLASTALPEDVPLDESTTIATVSMVDENATSAEVDASYVHVSDAIPRASRRARSNGKRSEWISILSESDVDDGTIVFSQPEADLDWRRGDDEMVVSSEMKRGMNRRIQLQGIVSPSQRIWLRLFMYAHLDRPCVRPSADECKCIARLTQLEPSTIERWFNSAQFAIVKRLQAHPSAWARAISQCAWYRREWRRRVHRHMERERERKQRLSYKPSH